jgi:hypothetical protein
MASKVKSRGFENVVLFSATAFLAYILIVKPQAKTATARKAAAMPWGTPSPSSPYYGTIDISTLPADTFLGSTPLNQTGQVGSGSVAALTPEELAAYYGETTAVSKAETVAIKQMQDTQAKAMLAEVPFVEGFDYQAVFGFAYPSTPVSDIGILPGVGGSYF